GGPAESVHQGITVRRYHDPWHAFAALYLPSVLLARAALRRAARDWSADLVHAHHGISGLGAARAHLGPRCYTFYGPWHLQLLAESATRRDRPAVTRWARRAWTPSKTALTRRIERAALRASARPVVLSRYSARQLETIHGVPAARTTIVPGGVDLDRFRPAAGRGAPRHALGLAASGPLVFTARRLVPDMGLEGLIEAMAALPGVRLVVGGDGWLRPRLVAQVMHLGLVDRVTFAGFIPEEALPLYYQAADLVVMPSVALEGFGLIALEALACGTPMVATADCGVVDVLEPLEPSWIAADASPAALARTIGPALEAVAGDPSVFARCRGHAETYPWSRMVEAYEALYR
ncbi:MAG: glycosyltransferase family 4 protein, partial [Candidatus Rokubacteria bacterium]|nr:glycosyltransferase family 4 protein [Candidatus Rokubacteria bacterium]